MGVSPSFKKFLRQLARGIKVLDKVNATITSVWVYPNLCKDLRLHVPKLFADSGVVIYQRDVIGIRYKLDIVFEISAPNR